MSLQRPPSSLLLRRYVHTGLLSLLLLSACAQPPPYGSPERTGTSPAILIESSGLAPSRRDAQLLWSHNDSGGQPVVYAMDPNGARRGDLRLQGVANHDWEDIASFELDGRAWLLIADTGDNASNRTDCAVYVVAEPDPADLSPTKETLTQVAWKIPVRYLDGPRDCEAVAVDARAGLIYLLAKRTSPHGLYTLPLRPPADGVLPAAMPVAQLPASHFPRPSVTQSMMPIPTGMYRAQPTGMDFAADGSAAVVVTYGDVLVFNRKPAERWADALSRTPVVLPPHGLTQAEAVTFGADSKTIYVTSEREGSAIMRYQAK